MAWFENIKIIKQYKDGKEIRSLTADINGRVGSISRWEVDDLIKEKVAQRLSEEVYSKVHDEIMSSISSEEIRKRLDDLVRRRIKREIFNVNDY